MTSMTLPHVQTALVQSPSSTSCSPSSLPLELSHDVPLPPLPSPHHVLVRVLAVALNPNDHKMVTHFPTPGSVAGCDFCGVVVEGRAVSQPPGPERSSPSHQHHPPGTRVCGALFPYKPGDEHNGSFAQFLAVDERLLLRVPDAWSDLEGAAMGGVGWSTVCLALSDPDALALPGTPLRPDEKGAPVVVYGGATATGTLACQLLSLSGYAPIAVTSAKSAPLALEYGAVGTAPYTSTRCAEQVRELAGGKPIRHALDCITDAESAALSFAVLSRVGGRYACLEAFHESWRSRRSIKVKEVMGFEILGVPVDLGPSVYSRPASADMFHIGCRWAVDMTRLVDAGKIWPHPVCEVRGGWQGILDGLTQLQRGEVRGQKLVVRIPPVA